MRYELAAQIKLEFDFESEAKVIDSLAEHPKVLTTECKQASEWYLEGSCWFCTVNFVVSMFSCVSYNIKCVTEGLCAVP